MIVDVPPRAGVVPAPPGSPGAVGTSVLRPPEDGLLFSKADTKRHMETAHRCRLSVVTGRLGGEPDPLIRTPFLVFGMRFDGQYGDVALLRAIRPK